MPLEFRPPDWLVKEYLQQKSPIQQASEGAQQTLQTYAQMQNQQQLQARAQQEEARKGRESFYQYGDPSGLAPQEQAGLAPAQGPQAPVPSTGTASGFQQPTPAYDPNNPAAMATIEHLRSFKENFPQGIKGQQFTEDTINTMDTQGNVVGQQTLKRPIKGKTILAKPGAAGGAVDAKKTFQLKGFRGTTPINYDTRTGKLIEGDPLETPLAPIIAPSIPSTEVSKVGELSNLKEKLGVLRQNFDPSFVGMMDAPMQAIKQKTGFGASEKGAYFKQATQDLKDSLLRARSGAQINEQEYQRLLPLVPNETMSETDFQAKTNRFEEVLSSMMATKQQAFQAAGYRTPDFKSLPQQPIQGGGLDAAKKARLEELRAKRAAGTLR